MNKVTRINNVIIDTDIGDDIDDALAVILAIGSPEINLMGITTVYKNTRLRAQIALKLLDVYEKSGIPVSAGIGIPLVNRVDCTEIPNEFGIVDKEMKSNCSMNAIDFIIDKVRNNDSIKILTLGALTNVAAAIVKEPELMKRADIIMMGGMISNPYPEGNINSDPESAAIVFESGMHITMVGLDVTLKCIMKDEHLKKIHEARNEKTRFLSRLIAIWNKEYLIPILKGWGMKLDEKTFGACPSLHDPLAVGYLIDPDMYVMKPSRILIETQGKYTRGVTVDSINVFNGKSNGYNADVCVDVDYDKFQDRFIERIL